MTTVTAIDNATTEKPETILSQGDQDNRLVKGKSMPSLR